MKLTAASLMSRKKMTKLIGREVEWVGTMTRFSDDGNNVMLVDVSHKGKILTDHVWIKIYDKIKLLKLGTKIKFIGIARTYTDSHGVRKNGLYKCFDFDIYDEEYFEALEDGAERIKRISRKTKSIRN